VPSRTVRQLERTKRNLAVLLLKLVINISATARGKLVVNSFRLRANGALTLFRSVQSQQLLPEQERSTSHALKSPKMELKRIAVTNCTFHSFLFPFESSVSRLVSDCEGEEEALLFFAIYRD
jgi:hypothetical protein